MIKWVRTQLAELTEGGPVTRFEAYHKTPGEEPERVWRYIVAEKDDAESISHAAWESAKENADCFADDGRPQYYVLCSYRGDDSDTPDLQHPFTIANKALKFQFEGTEGAPNETGIIAQVLRHTENNHKLVMGMVQSTSGHLIEEVENLRRENKRLEGFITEQNKAFQDNLDRKHARQIEEAKFVANQERMGQLMKLVGVATPLVMNKLLGPAPLKPVGGVPAVKVPAVAGAEAPVAALPDAPAAPEDTFRSKVTRVLSGFSMEELGAVMGNISESNQQALLDLYQTITTEAPEATPSEESSNGKEQDNQVRRHPVRAGSSEGPSQGAGASSQGDKQAQATARSAVKRTRNVSGSGAGKRSGSQGASKRAPHPKAGTAVREDRKAKSGQGVRADSSGARPRKGGRPAANAKRGKARS
jgi:hypothetical protein